MEPGKGTDIDARELAAPDSPEVGISTQQRSSRSPSPEAQEVTERMSISSQNMRNLFGGAQAPSRASVESAESQLSFANQKSFVVDNAPKYEHKRLDKFNR